MRDKGEQNPQEGKVLILVGSILGILLLLAGAGSFLMEWCGFKLADVGSLFIKLLPILLGVIVLVALILLGGTLLLFKHHCNRD